MRGSSPVLAILTLVAGAAWAGPGIHNLELVGRMALGPGFNADVWVHRGFAYVGTWGGASRCPALGVKIVDVTDPAAPSFVGTVAAQPNTRSEDMVVRSVSNSLFRGDLLAVGQQMCLHLPGQPGQHGVALFDVSDPRNPRELSFFDSGEESHGVHELDLVARPDGRVLVLAASLARLRILDVSDPRNPRQLSDWNITERLGEPPSSSKFVHSATASADGMMAFVSYWDAGVIILDISDPANPRYLGRTGFAPGEEGNAHSVSISPDQRLLLTADEDTNAGSATAGFNDWGFLRLFDVSDPAAPRQLGTFLTANARTDRVHGPPDGGVYSIHNPVLAGDLGYLSWYSDGIRVVDLVNRSAPLEVASYVPIGAADPFGVFAPLAQMWGVYVDGERNLIFASDMNYGLYILRPAAPNPGRSVVHAATFAEGAVAPGTLVTLFGTQLAGATAAASSTPVPVQLAGATVRVNGAPARVVYASPTQLNFIMPMDAALGTARVNVQNLGRSGREVEVQVAEAAPGLFTQSQDGRGLAAALRASDHLPLNATRPAKAGEVIELYVSGLGRSGAPVSVTIGGRAAEVLFAGAAPGFDGLQQVNVRIPSGLRGSQDVVVGVAGRFSNVALLPVE
jgi:uncharacterized protein (TIGR03437 family)